MAEARNKTELTRVSVDAFLETIADDQQRIDCKRVVEMMEHLTGEQGKMWGSAIIGFGLRHLKYESGREMDWMEIGFSPRKGSTTLYVLSKSLDHSPMLAKLGKHKASGGCLHIKKLSDIDEKALEKLIEDYLDFIRKGGV